VPPAAELPTCPHYVIATKTIELGDIDIHLRTLRNRQEYSDDDGVTARLGIHSSNWSLYGVVWASGEMLAHEVEHGYSHQQGTPDDISTLTQPLPPCIAIAQIDLAIRATLVNDKPA
jgi:hypothetical protein